MDADKLTAAELNTAIGKLTGAQLNTAIARARGWRWGLLKNGALAWIRPDGGAERGLQDWASNIAAAWELEGEFTTPEEQNRYAWAVWDVVVGDEVPKGRERSFRYDLIHATPTQRCCAYLKMKGAIDAN